MGRFANAGVNHLPMVGSCWKTKKKYVQNLFWRKIFYFSRYFFSKICLYGAKNRPKRGATPRTHIWSFWQILEVQYLEKQKNFRHKNLLSYFFYFSQQLPSIGRCSTHVSAKIKIFRFFGIFLVTIFWQHIAHFRLVFLIVSGRISKKKILESLKTI